MTFDEAVEVLMGWLERQVVAVTWAQGEEPPPPTPMPGTLSRREMWPHVEPEDNPQARGEVEFFNVLRPERMSHLVNPDGSTFALYRDSITECDWLPRQEGRALVFRTDGACIAFWLAD